jgi:hypothetical protein
MRYLTSTLLLSLLPSALTSCCDCYGAISDNFCYTCESAKEAYEVRGWAYKAQDFQQCNPAAPCPLEGVCNFGCLGTLSENGTAVFCLTEIFSLNGRIDSVPDMWVSFDGKILQLTSRAYTKMPSMDPVMLEPLVNLQGLSLTLGSPIPENLFSHLSKTLRSIDISRQLCGVEFPPDIFNGLDGLISIKATSMCESPYLWNEGIFSSLPQGTIVDIDRVGWYNDCPTGSKYIAETSQIAAHCEKPPYYMGTTPPGTTSGVTYPVPGSESGSSDLCGGNNACGIAFYCVGVSLWCAAAAWCKYNQRKRAPTVPAKPGGATGFSPPNYAGARGGPAAAPNYGSSPNYGNNLQGGYYGPGANNSTGVVGANVTTGVAYSPQYNTSPNPYPPVVNAYPEGAASPSHDSNKAGTSVAPISPYTTPSPAYMTTAPGPSAYTGNYPTFNAPTYGNANGVGDGALLL